jgi:hypothetical protein
LSIERTNRTTVVAIITILAIINVICCQDKFWSTYILPVKIGIFIHRNTPLLLMPPSAYTFWLRKISWIMERDIARLHPRIAAIKKRKAVEFIIDITHL